MEERSARNVLESHLSYRKQRNVEDDLRENYDQQVVVLTGWGKYRGHDGMRKLVAE